MRLIDSLCVHAGAYVASSIHSCKTMLYVTSVKLFMLFSLLFRFWKILLVYFGYSSGVRTPDSLGFSNYNSHSYSTQC